LARCRLGNTSARKLRKKSP